MNLKMRMRVERMVVGKLLSVAKAEGWEAWAVDDGGDELVKMKGTTAKEVLEAVFAVDESRIYFKKTVPGAEKPARGWAFIVLGNDGWDAICDAAPAVGEFNDKVLEPVSAYCEKLEETYC